MADEEIKCDNINYAVYKIEDWENDYEINILGTARENPVTKPTLDHMLKQWIILEYLYLKLVEKK